MKIVLAVEYYPDSNKGDFSGGVEARAYYMAKELSKKNKIIILTSWRKNQKRYTKDGNIEIYRLGINHKYSNKGGFFSRFIFQISLYNKLKKLKSDVVDGFNFTTYIPAYFGAKKIKAKKVCTYHETWLGNWIKNKGVITGLAGEIMERISLKLNWDKIFPVSNFTKNRLIDNGILHSKLHVVYNGVIVEEFIKNKSVKSKDF